MSTQSQITANQANAQQSTGPRTAEGKSIASQNSTKHGLTGKFVLIAAEDPDEFLAYMQEYFSQHNPATMDEQFLVRQMAEAMWRLRRVQRLELPLFDTAPLANPFTDADHSKELLNLTRYQKSLESSYFRASRELRTIRKEQADTVKKEEKQEVAAVQAEAPVQTEAEAEKKQKIAEFNAALDEIMFAPLPVWENPNEIGPNGRQTKRSQSEPHQAAGKAAGQK